MVPLPICAVCGEPIGVYERAAIVDRSGPARMTSLAREPELADDGTPLIHATCAAALGDMAGSPASH